MHDPSRKVTVSINGIEDADNTHEYNERRFLQTEEKFRAALSAFWESGAHVDNIEEAIASTLTDEVL